jgi:hypothetical protein
MQKEPITKNLDSLSLEQLKNEYVLVVNEIENRSLTSMSGKMFKNISWTSLCDMKNKINLLLEIRG